MIACGVFSETASLGAVLIHSPGGEFERMVPHHIEPTQRHADGSYLRNNDYLLYDDLLDLPRLQEEHAVFKKVLAKKVGRQGVLEWLDLAREVLHESSGRETLFKALAAHSLSPRVGASSLQALLATGSPDEILSGVVSGVGPDGPVFENPAPNLMFARDMGAVVGRNLVLPVARHPARTRDMAIARTVFAHHPIFEGLNVIDITQGGGETPVAFEGGDLLVLSPSVVMIGVGIRTNEAGARRVARALLEGGVEHVLLVELPRWRGAMHLDTVFTMLAPSLCLGYLPALGPVGQQEGPTITALHREGETRCNNVSLVQILKEFEMDLEVVPCGGGVSPYEEREQWTDGANAFALQEGTILLYRRNAKTIGILADWGYNALSADEWLECGDPEGHSKTVVMIEGGELSRGRGGPRCLTFPVARDGGRGRALP